jgi:hypothetical protein
MVLQSDLHGDMQLTRIERKSVEVKVVDWPKDNCYYVTSWEQLGFGVHNTAGVVGATLTLDSKYLPAVQPLS